MKTKILPFLLNLQLFADGDDDKTDDDELNLDDFDDEDDEEDKDKDKGDGKKDKTPEEIEKEKQTRKKNAEEARKRREREQKEAIEKAAKEAYEKGLREGKRGALKTNPFTGEPIEDDIDVADYELMQKLKEEGKDPIKDFPKAKAALERELKSKEAENEKKKKEEEDKKTKLLEDEKKDRADFVKAVGGKDKAIEIFKDPDFKIFAKGRIGNEPLTTIYNDFVAFKKKFSGKGDDNQPDVPGANSGNDDDKPNTKKMTKEEHDAYMKKKYHG